MADTLQEITWPLDQPFYTGPGAVPLEEVGLPCAVNGRGFLIDFREEVGYLYRFRQTSVNLLNTQQANSGGDQSQVPPDGLTRVVPEPTADGRAAACRRGSGSGSGAVG